jgi:tRNA dimethylallyltransferase
VRLLMLLGPTAVGKTEVAMALQDELGGTARVRLISVDSAMVYRGMNIGTAKPEPAVLTAYPHDLVDIRDPAETYAVADFIADADRAVREALARGQTPVMVGGTMLYAWRYMQGIATLPSADPALRARLAEEYERRGAPAMHAELARVDPPAAANIHPNNPQRLLRALEVVRLTGKPLSALWRQREGADLAARLGIDLRHVVVAAIEPTDRSELHRRIARRFDHMLDSGFVDEVRTLFDRDDLHADLPALRAVGYRQGWQYLQGELTLDGFREAAVAATRQLAKRQLTWLRNWPDPVRLTWDQTARNAAQLRGLLA